MASKRAIATYELLGQPTTPGTYPLKGLGIAEITQKDIDSWKERSFAGHVVLASSLNGGGHQTLWQVINFAP